MEIGDAVRPNSKAPLRYGEDALIVGKPPKGSVYDWAVTFIDTPEAGTAYYFEMELDLVAAESGGAADTGEGTIE